MFLYFFIFRKVNWKGCELNYETVLEGLLIRTDAAPRELCSQCESQVCTFIHSLVRFKVNCSSQMYGQLSALQKKSKHLIPSDKSRGLFICGTHWNSASTLSTPSYGSQIAPASSIILHKAPCCCVIVAWRHSGEFRVQQLCACQPERDSHHHGS